MFWFMSPWEAARYSLEAQRRVMALPWLFFASGRRQEGYTDGEQALSVAPPPVPASSMTAARPRAIPARRAIETIKEPLSARSGKHKRARRKNKIRKRSELTS
jgi:hypothetical protein